MAIVRERWVGSTGVWDTDGNWSNAHPGASDIAWFDGTSNQNVTTAPTATTENVPIVVERNHLGDIGTSGAPIVLASDYVKYLGRGSMYYNNNDNTNTTPTDYIYINSPNTELAMEINGDEVTNIIVTSGRVVINASLQHDFNLLVNGPQAIVEIQVGAATGAGAAASTILQTAGEITSHIDFGNCDVQGGVFNQESIKHGPLQISGGGVFNGNFRDEDDANHEFDGTITIGNGGILNLVNQQQFGQYSSSASPIVVGEGGLIRYVDGTVSAGGGGIILAGGREEKY